MLLTNRPIGYGFSPDPAKEFRQCPGAARPITRNLTAAQREAVLQFGSRSDGGTVTLKVYQELVELGILGLRSADGQVEITEMGRALYDELVWQLAT